MAGHGLTRQVVLTVPGFFFALAVLAESDLLAALPRRFVAMHGRRFGVAARESPLRLSGSRLHAVATEAGMMDAGLAWLMELMASLGEEAAPRSSARGPARTPRRRPRDHEAVPRFHPNV
jgi:hypothetical protein